MKVLLRLSIHLYGTNTQNTDENNLKGLEELRRKFIISKKEEETKILEKLLRRILPFARITEGGEVMLERKNLAQIDRIALVLVARFLGARLSENISQEVTLEEIFRMAGVKKKVASARTSELIKDGIVDMVSRGRYKIRSLITAEEVIKRLEEKYILDNGEMKDDV